LSGFFAALASRRMAAALLLGFSCGLPLPLTGQVLQAWLKASGVELAAIGLVALIGLPYTLKFLWSPLFDRYELPFLGRRRGWLLIAQAAVAGALVLLALGDPILSPTLVGAAALAVALASASQDIVVDAHRRETLAEHELGMGSSLYVYGYRTAMLVGSGGGLLLADAVGFRTTYLVMAAGMIVGMAATLLAPEAPPVEDRPATLREAVVEPLRDYFGRPHAIAILTFVLLYKLGDTMAAAMTTPFYLDLGFTLTEVGSIVKLFGYWATLGGLFVGGAILFRLGIFASLWIFGILQAVSTAGFAILAAIGPDLRGLTAVVTFENLTAGMGTAAYAAFMASLTNRRFTATQYALLSSLMGVPRVLFAAPTGWMAERLGWIEFFLVCTVVALPGLALLTRFRAWTPSPPVASAEASPRGAAAPGA
jgi:MFS transporter, PAT family, beta-lactamase induction signal transducer AmpG